MTRVFIVALSFAVGAAAAAIEVVDDLSPRQEERYRRLLKELRCLVCQNQSLADSGADLAGDMRETVRAMLRDGRADADIRDFLKARYGDFIIYRPPFNAATLLLWAGPFAVLAAGLCAAVVLLRRRRAPPAALEDGEARRAAELLRD